MRWPLLVIALPLLGAPVVDAQEGFEPCQGFLWMEEWQVCYQLAVRDVLGDEDAWPLVEMVVLPSFSAEWRMGVYREEGDAGGTRVVVSRADEPVWDAGPWDSCLTGGRPPRPGITRTLSRAPIAAQLGNELSDLVRAAILSVNPRDDKVGPGLGAFPEPEDDESIRIGCDGVTYYVSVRGRCATTWSPDEGTAEGEIVALLEEIGDLVNSGRFGEMAQKALLARVLDLRTRLDRRQGIAVLRPATE